MRLLDLILSLALFCILTSAVFDSYASCQKLAGLERQIRLEYCQMKFLAGSFCLTCGGQGFDSLDEWESVCKALWSLDYVDWKEVESGEPVGGLEAGLAGGCADAGNFVACEESYESGGCGLVASGFLSDVTGGDGRPDLQNQSIYFGKWSGPYGSGQIYCGKKDWKENEKKF